MRPVKFTADGIIDAETGEKIDMSSPEFREMIGKSNSGKRPSPEKKEEPKEKNPTPPKKEVKQSPPEKESDSPSLSSYTGPKPVSYTKYEVTPESTFTVRFCLGFDEGRPHVYVESAKTAHPEYESHWVRFRMWNYREQMDWRQKSTDYDSMTGVSRLNSVKFNEMKVRNLLKDWSFGEYDPKFRLLHVNGILSDESYNLFMGMFSSIVDNIIFMMNQVLEDNQ